jgi:hypothetical protein
MRQVSWDGAETINCVLEVVCMQENFPQVGSSRQLGPYDKITKLWGNAPLEQDQIGMYSCANHANITLSLPHAKISSADADLKVEPPKDASTFHPGEFVALSYCWGDADAGENPTVNGTSVTARKNLVSALRALRAKAPIQQGLKVWVDGLCINQDDVIEKNEHIQRMSSVYQTAKCIVGWLGDESHDSTRAVEVINVVASEWKRSNTDKWSFTLADNNGLCNRGDLLAIQNLMARAFWRRVWIKQELALGAPDMPLLCGRDVVCWGQLYDAIYLATYSSLSLVDTMLKDGSQ